MQHDDSDDRKRPEQGRPTRTEDAVPSNLADREPAEGGEIPDAGAGAEHATPSGDDDDDREVADDV